MTRTGRTRAQRRAERAAQQQPERTAAGEGAGRFHLVWWDVWQLECCGEAFAVGEEVTWTVTEPHREFLRTVLGPVAEEVTSAEEHHGGGRGQNLRSVTGRVRGIDLVLCRYVPEAPGSATHVPVPASMRREPLVEANATEVAPEGLSRAGYLVELVET